MSAQTLLFTSGSAWSVRDNATAVLLAISIGFVAWGVSVSTRRTSAFPFPPGPPGKFLIGNVLDFDVFRPWIAFTEWKAKYGDIVGVQVPGTKIIALNSQKVINDLFEKRGNIYSDRPFLPFAVEGCDMKRSPALMPYGPEWRACRKIQNVGLSPSAVKQYQGVQEDISALMAKEFLEKPHDFFELSRLCAGRIVLAVTYGLSIKSIDNDHILRAEDTMKYVTEAISPGAHLADLFPILMHLPSWLPFQKRMNMIKHKIYALNSFPFNEAKSNLASGEARPSLTRDVFTNLSEENNNAEFEERVEWSLGALYAAGGETTFALVLNFLLVMALHPDKQTKAQAELDAHIGNRLPVIADRGTMPYVEACIKETLRWNPIVPLGIPHCAAQDDVYEGYFIPKGTILMPNTWPMAFAPNAKYPPREFIPERFLDPEDTTIDPAFYTFGYGRRVCPGRYLAENSTFILVATILSVFKVSPPPASEGPLVPEWAANTVSFLKPFKLTIEPRSADKVEMVYKKASKSTI
ncbi:cytochrome P450 [Amylostereum chailletii]|nr:cytochrome P450 [Amylostereum chailletii]